MLDCGSSKVMRGFNFLKGHWEAVECVQRLKNDRVSVSRGTGSGDLGEVRLVRERERERE